MLQEKKNGHNFDVISGKGKVHPESGHEGPEGCRGIALLL